MPIASNLSPWIAYRKPNPTAQLRLFCFPYAGGSASIFRSWQEKLPPEVEVCPIQYPGRENRLAEQPYRHLSLLLEGLSQIIRSYLDLPFALYGHSLGGYVSFELIRQLVNERGPNPVHLFVSGCRAPQLPNTDPPIHALPDSEFIHELRRLNGTPELVLQNAELMELLMPVLRADFEIVETYHYHHPKGELWDWPVTVFGGMSDGEVAEAELAAWREHTRSTFRVQMFPGDHFFLQSAQPELLQTLALSLHPHIRHE